MVFCINSILKRQVRWGGVIGSLNLVPKLVFNIPTSIKYKKVLLGYSLCRSILAFQFRSNFRLIPALYVKITSFYVNIFPPYSTVGFFHSFPWIARTQCAQEGWEGGVERLVNNNLWMCKQNYYGARCIVPSRGPIPGPGPDPCPVGDWGGNICV